MTSSEHTRPASMAEPLAVLHHAADTIDDLDESRKTRLEDGCGGGHVFAQLFESAKHLYAGAAILHLERHLGIPQLQHWDVKNADEAVAALREAAGINLATDTAVDALHRRLRGFHNELAAALDSDEIQTGQMVGQISRAAERNKAAIARMEQRMEDQSLCYQGKLVAKDKTIDRLERWNKHWQELARDHTDHCAGCDRCEIEDGADV